MRHCAIPAGTHRPSAPISAASFHCSLVGRVDEARRRFEALLALGNDIGLFGEEHDLETGNTLGNFPQAFTHVALIHAAVTLAGVTEPTRLEASDAL